LEPPEVDEAAADREESFMDLVAAVVMDEQPPEVMKPGDGMLNHPADAAEPRAVLSLTTSDL
jgi:hypothetical protein